MQGGVFLISPDPQLIRNSLHNIAWQHHYVPLTQSCSRAAKICKVDCDNRYEDKPAACKIERCWSDGGLDSQNCRLMNVGKWTAAGL